MEARLSAAETLLSQDDCHEARRLASHVAACATSSALCNRAHILLAWVALGQGRPRRAKEELDRIDPPHEIDVYTFAAVEAALGRTVLAIRALEMLIPNGALGCEGAKLLIELYARTGHFDRAVTIAIAYRQVLGARDCWLVVGAAEEAGALQPARQLASHLGARAAETALTAERLSYGVPIG